MDERIKELKEERNRINQMIKELEGKSAFYGSVKIACEHFSCAPDEWFLGVKVKSLHGNQPFKWRSAIRGETKQDVIDQIEPLINDLSGLLGKVKKMKGE